MCLLNRNSKAQKISFDWMKEKVTDDLSGRSANFNLVIYNLRDLWKKTDVGTTKKLLSAEIPGHDVLMLKLTKMK